MEKFGVIYPKIYIRDFGVYSFIYKDELVKDLAQYFDRGNKELFESNANKLDFLFRIEGFKKYFLETVVTDCFFNVVDSDLTKLKGKDIIVVIPAGHIGRYGVRAEIATVLVNQLKDLGCNIRVIITSGLRKMGQDEYEKSRLIGNSSDQDENRWWSSRIPNLTKKLGLEADKFIALQGATKVLGGSRASTEDNGLDLNNELTSKNEQCENIFYVAEEPFGERMTAAMNGRLSYKYNIELFQAPVARNNLEDRLKSPSDDDIFVTLNQLYNLIRSQRAREVLLKKEADKRIWLALK